MGKEVDNWLTNTLFLDFPNFRKSVIVKTKDYEVENTSKVEEIIKISLNIKEIENLYLSEEINYVDRMSHIFNEKWQSISQGDEEISETLKFHQDGTKKEMSRVLSRNKYATEASK